MSSIRQNEINKIILDASNKFDITVRLKGGDPFLFGRGGEEAELLKENNIDFEVIPGVSALIAVPEYAGIPVTHRDVSHGIIAATGHNVEKLNIPSLGENKSSYTLIIFMGSKHINEIIDKLLFLGYSENTKIAVIENGTHKDQRMLFQIIWTSLQNHLHLQISRMSLPNLAIQYFRYFICFQIQKCLILLREFHLIQQV